NAIGPEIDVPLGREVALAPLRMLLGPCLFEPANGRCREAGRILADERGEHLLEVASRDALEVEDRDQHLEALRPARIGRQDGRGKPDALAGARPGLAIAHTRLAHRNRANASHDLAL